MSRNHPSRGISSSYSLTSQQAKICIPHPGPYLTVDGASSRSPKLASDARRQDKRVPCTLLVLIRQFPSHTMSADCISKILTLANVRPLPIQGLLYRVSMPERLHPQTFGQRSRASDVEPAGWSTHSWLQSSIHKRLFYRMDDPCCECRGYENSQSLALGFLAIIQIRHPGLLFE